MLNPLQTSENFNNAYTNLKIMMITNTCESFQERILRLSLSLIFYELWWAMNSLRSCWKKNYYWFSRKYEKNNMNCSRFIQTSCSEYTISEIMKYLEVRYWISLNLFILHWKLSGCSPQQFPLKIHWLLSIYLHKTTYKSKLSTRRGHVSTF